MSLIEQAQRYYDELPPHAKERKGGFYIKELLELLRVDITELERVPAIYTLFYCEKIDLKRNFSLLGVFETEKHAKSYMTKQNTFLYFIDEYDSGAPTKNIRIYQSW